MTQLRMKHFYFQICQINICITQTELLNRSCKQIQVFKTPQDKKTSGLSAQTIDKQIQIKYLLKIHRITLGFGLEPSSQGNVYFLSTVLCLVRTIYLSNKQEIPALQVSFQTAKMMRDFLSFGRDNPNTLCATHRILEVVSSLIDIYVINSFLTNLV